MCETELTVSYPLRISLALDGLDFNGIVGASGKSHPRTPVGREDELRAKGIEIRHEGDRS